MPTETRRKSYQSHGVPLLRIQMMLPRLGIETIDGFYDRLADALFRYAESSAAAHEALLQSLTRRERARFHEKILMYRAEVTFADERFLSVRADFSEEEKTAARRTVRMGQIFSCEHGWLLSPADFTAERIPRGFSEAYLTGEGLVAVKNGDAPFERLFPSKIQKIP